MNLDLQDRELLADAIGDSVAGYLKPHTEQSNKLTLKEALTLVMLSPASASPHSKYWQSTKEIIEYAEGLKEAYDKKLKENE